MKFQFIEDPSIPKMGWCLRVDKKSPSVKVAHGEMVERDTDFFVEGVWSEPFADKGISSSLNLMGSGAVINNDQLVVCTPSNTLEAVYSIYKDEETLFFSNSISFLLAAAKEELDPKYPYYESDILSISEGLSKYIKQIPTLNGKKISIHYFCNIVVDIDLKTQEEKKVRPKEFNTYEDYYSFLISSLKGISENANDKRRNHKFEPIVFSSNGYDSSACAALGKEVNCETAVVYESKKGLRSDSGKHVVESLKYKTVIEKDELDYLNFNTAHEFVGTGELGTSIFFAASEKELEGKYLLSGAHGDKIWSKDMKSNPDLKRSFYPDTAKKEFRLRVGFVNVTVPFFAVEAHEQINQITNSSEMKAWTLGNDYDRPIPRRIAEEKGVPRNLFGMTKGGGAGSNLRFAGLDYLEKVMPQGSFEDFKEYYKEHRVLRLGCLHLHFTYFLYCLSIFMRKKGFNIFDKILKTDKWKRKYTCSPWAPSYLFIWGTEKLIKEYKKAAENFYKGGESSKTRAS